MAEPVLLIEKQDGVVTLTLNRPQAMNALSRELRAAVVRAFAAIRDDSECAAVILTGAGRAFCAGLDLKELGGEAGSPGDRDAVTGTEFIRSVLECDRPVIGAINGPAITGGFELALACDFLIASSAARFADTHARVGIVPGWGLSQRLPRLIGIGRAKELAFTGNFLSAEQAAAWGVVNRVVAPEELLPTCRALAREIRSCVPEAIRAIKRAIDGGYALSLAEGLELEGALSRSYGQSVTPELIAQRRQAVVERGRRQAAAPDRASEGA